MLLFWLLVLLNFGALIISLMWLVANPTYEPAAVTIALGANLAGVFYSKSHWERPPARKTIIQRNNIAGGDIAAGNITKSGEPPSGV